VNHGSGQQGKSLYSSFIYRMKPGFGRFFRRACNWSWNVLLWEDTQVWENKVLMITGLQAYKTTGDALKFFDVILLKLQESKACAEIGGLMKNNSFTENFNYRILYLTCMPTTSPDVRIHCHL
jgi:hypothetical protein